MIKLVAKQKLGFRNPETGEIVTAEPYAFSTFPDWIEKDPMYGWALADGAIEVSGELEPETADKQEEKSPKKTGGTTSQESNKKE